MSFQGCYFLILNDPEAVVQRRLAVEMAGLLGFHSLALDLPVVLEEMPRDAAESGDFFIEIGRESRTADDVLSACSMQIYPRKEEDVGELIKLFMEEWEQLLPAHPSPRRATLSPADLASDTVLSALSPERCESLKLEQFLSTGPFLPDRTGTRMSDDLAVYLVANLESSRDVFMAAADLASILGAQTRVYRYPLLLPAEGAREDRPGRVVLSEADIPARLEKTGELSICLSGRGMAQLTRLLPSLLLDEDRGIHLGDWLSDLSEALRLRHPDGEFAYTKAAGACLPGREGWFLSPATIEDYRSQIESPERELASYLEKLAVWEKNYELPWELDLFRQAVEPVLDKLPRGSKIRLKASLSEDRSVRAGLLKWLAEKAQKLEIALEAEIYCSYKQGYSWIEEYLLPRLRGQAVERVEIRFRPFLPEGETEWKDEEGVIPQLSSERGDQPQRYFDLPIRYLQELYPIDERVAEYLSICKDQVQFVADEPNAEQSYRFLAYTKEGELVLDERHSVYHHERPYLSAYPELGKVHPNSGFVQIFHDSECLLDLRIRTDLDRVWDLYQDEILPQLREEIIQRFGTEAQESDQPFFRSLEMDLTVSEPDEELPSRQDRLSSLDAMHEDFYFVGLDFFKTFGLRSSGANLDSPGLLLPLIHKAEGPPKIRFTLFQSRFTEPMRRVDRSFMPLREAVRLDEVELLSLTLDGGQAAASFLVRGGGELSALLRAYGTLLQEGCLSYDLRHLPLRRLDFHLELDDGREHLSWNLEEAKASWAAREKISREEIPEFLTALDFSEREVIGYEKYLELIGELRRIPSLNVFLLSRSYEGRKIFGLRLLPERRGWRPRLRWMEHLPSLLLNARHHANEVSSTQSSFMLLRQLLLHEDWHGLAESINLLFIPLENVDGAALHHQLQLEHPRWKLHVARYNALGKEFAREYFKDETMHTTALGFTRLWRRWLPDLVVDDHGVPSHEWDQPFSGYSSPWFKGFWLPRALLYSYFYHVQDERFKGNLSLNKAMEDVVAESLLTDDEIAALNAEWMEVFEKYAHRWLPNLFPAKYYKNMISYWIPSAWNPAHSYAAIRYPWISSVSFVSEVSDETAQGEYLELCARAHLTHNLAVLRWLRSARVGRRREITGEKSERRLSERRLRPIQA